jgi:arylsulfatase A-like enzyme
MGRKILFITTDQMRYDALGCNGGRVARTPVVDGLAKDGYRYERMNAQSVVCMPARSSMITGQHVRTHGVFMNGVPLPVDAPSVAAHLAEHAGYRTALIGKAHFEPHLDIQRQFYENQMSARGEFGPHRGFDHMELATHSPLILHYGKWLRENDPEALGHFYMNLTPELRVNHAGGGDTGAIQVHDNKIRREHYHTDWVADRTIAYLDSLDADEDFFVWMSFPDPHHPWDPPASEKGRVPWRDLDLPENHPASVAKAREIIAGKPGHWSDYFEGRNVSNMEAPPGFVPAELAANQLREIDALTHVENELIDEACGRVLGHIESRGWRDDTDVLFTTDHGEFQGDFGLLFKGPYHVDSLMRLPLIWRPARNVGARPSVVKAPVGQVDLAPTFCEIAGVPVPEWMEGTALPVSDAAANAQGRERVLTEWESEFEGDSIYLRTIYRDGLVCTVYERSSLYDVDSGTVGELYDLREDPRQWVNLWGDEARQGIKKELIADLYSHLPEARKQRLEIVAPV